MEFVSVEAKEDGPLVFSDDEENEKITDELDDSIDDSTQPQEDVSFYRQLDSNNIKNIQNFMVRHVILLRQFMRTMNLFTIMKTNSQNFTLQRIESMLLLTNSRALKDLSKNLKRPLKILKIVKISFLTL